PCESRATLPVAAPDSPGGGSGPGGNVDVGSFSSAALLQLIQSDTGQLGASAGSVAAIAQGSADPNVVASAVLNLLLSSLDSQIRVSRRSMLANAVTNDLHVVEKNDYLEGNGRHESFETDLSGTATDYEDVTLSAIGVDRTDIIFPGVVNLVDEDEKIRARIGWSRAELVHRGKFKWSVRARNIASGLIETPLCGHLYVARDTFPDSADT
ncbi:MAG: hypothetical protein AAFU85_28485, partial [Planctomycetota bacterium]